MEATSIGATAAVLFPGQYRRRVLSLLLLRPDESFHVRAIARMTGTTPGTMNKELSKLHEAGLLNRSRIGNLLQYSANREHPVFSELASILKKTVGAADVLAHALAPLSDAIEVAFVFGSVARGTETMGSDIDLLIIGSPSFADAIEALYPAQSALGREINPKVFSRKEWLDRVKAKDPFVMEVLSRSKVFVVGGEDELAKPGRHQP